MAYIPPHKRHSKGTGRSSPPKPELMRPLFNKNNPKFKSSRTINFNDLRCTKIVYANTAISRWFAVGFDDDDNGDQSKFPSSVSLQPVSFESVERKVGEKPLDMILNEIAEAKERVLRSPWVYIAENVAKDLLASFECLRNEMGSNESEELRPTLVARFGKILFWRGSSFNQEVSALEDLVCDEETLRRLKRSLNSSLPKSYMEYILKEGAQKIGVEFQAEKDVYHVKLSDSTRPDSTISCKCRVSKDGKLELYKTELNLVRHMVTDISCLDKNVDLRLMLCAKRIISSLSDDDMQSIRELIDSAVLDPGVKGGLRWSLGKSSSGDKFRVVGVWHTKTISYVNRSMRLKVRIADRFICRTSSGEVSREIIIKLKKIASELKEQNVDENAVKEMLKDDFRVIWDIASSAVKAFRNGSWCLFINHCHCVKCY